MSARRGKESTQKEGKSNKKRKIELSTIETTQIEALVESGSRDFRVWIAFLRGVNVGGGNKLPMKQLVANLSKQNGMTMVSSYIQSGNIIFRYPAHENEQTIRDLVQETVKNTLRNGNSPLIKLMSAESVMRIMESNPFKDEAKERGSRMFFYLLCDELENQMMKNHDSLWSDHLQPDEKIFLNVTEKVVYLLLPGGTWNCKVASKIETILKAKTTARNQNTLQKMHQLALDLESK